LTKVQIIHALETGLHNPEISFDCDI